MDAFELLKTDHKRVAAIFEKLEPTTERALKTRQELFEKLNEELTVHAAIEEKFLYPVLKDEKDTHDIAFEAVEEHRIVKELLKELQALPPDSPEWTAKLTVLKENVEHHDGRLELIDWAALNRLSFFTPRRASVSEPA